MSENDSNSIEAYVEVIARICHEANRAWCAHWKNDPQLPWDDAPYEQKNSALNGVRFVIDELRKGTELTPRNLHENWFNHKVSQGWKWGKTRDASKKEHNCLLPYEELNQKEKLKDKLFLYIVLSFIE